MMKKLRSRMGGIFPGLIVGYLAVGSAYVFTTAAMGFNETLKNGVAKRNWNVIKCKAANKGEQFCNEKYGYVPNK